MKKLKTKNEKMLLLIGVDVGNGDTKTANSKMHTGIKTVQDASIAKNVLLMDGITTIMGEGHIAYMEDRTIDENYRRLTCQAIANEVRINGMTPGTYEIYLGVGVPFQHWNGMKDRMKSYFMEKPLMNFISNGEEYSIRIQDVAVMPQGYSAVAMQLGRYRGLTWIVDIGNGTLDCITLSEGVANETKSFTEKLGTYQCYLLAKEKIKDTTLKDLPYEVFESYLIQGNVDLNLPEEWTSCIDAGVREYCERVFSTLREHGYSDDYTKLVFLGGGASVVKKYCKDSYRFDFITDVHANAKGYEEFYYCNLLRKGEICE